MILALYLFYLPASIKFGFLRKASSTRENIHISAATLDVFFSKTLEHDARWDRCHNALGAAAVMEAYWVLFCRVAYVLCMLVSVTSQGLYSVLCYSKAQYCKRSTSHQIAKAGTACARLKYRYFRCRKTLGAWVRGNTLHLARIVSCAKKYHAR